MSGDGDDTAGTADHNRHADLIEHDEWPVHQPDAPDAPIPGRHWYSGCNPDRPRVNPATGICEDCGGVACRECGREACPDHPAV